ncbi:MAG: starvation-sensing protein RspA [Bryobacterales bacterium]|nr:starvation-sensing protein RspA [Bryobacterales bacterium]
MPSPTIKDVSVIATAPAGLRLTVVKITTDQDGLYGYGCGTYTQRAELVNAAVDKYLRPFLLGKPADRIDDLWQAMYNSSYWRNGPVLNNAISGVDQALWDIKGRQAGMPVYQVLGGKCREAADCYGHAGGAEIPEVIESARSFMARGFRHVRCQIGVPNMAAYGSGGGRTYGGGRAPESASRAATGALHQAPLYEPAYYMRRAIRMLEECRKQLGEEIELLHDIHERLLPQQALQFAKDVEPLKLFFLEDPFSPEDIGYFRILRQQCATPIAMGELFNSPHEWTPLIAERLIDYIRVHVSQAGGLTPCRKIAAMGEIYGVRTAWHGPGDVSPVGHAANIALDLACWNFGIQEYSTFSEPLQEVFKGCPVMKEGYLYANEAPGWGIEVDEKLAAKYPYGHREQGERQRLNGGWGEVRKRDGTIIKQ